MIEDKLYRLIVENSPNMIWRAGTDTLCDYFNTTWLRFTGKQLHEEAGNGWAEGVHPDDFDFCLKIYLEAFNARQDFEMEYRLKRHDGEYRWINDKGTPYYDEGQFAGYIGSCIDVTDKVEGQRLIKMAQTDGLTGINNRQYFQILAEAEFNNAMNDMRSLSIAILDIDKFKFINDNLGHLAGDAVLIEFAKRLKNNIRTSDIVARFGGDEFVILFTNTKANECEALINRIAQRVCDEEFCFNDNIIKLTISYGISEMYGNNSLYEMLSKADKGLYVMKNSKR